MMTESEKTNAKWGCLYLLLVVPLVVLRGFAIQQCWNWFVPSVLGLRPIELVQALGLSLTASVLAFRYPSKEEYEADEDRVKRNIIMGIFYPLIVLGIGYIYTQLM